MSPPPELVGIGDGAGYFVAGGSYFLTFLVFFHNFVCSANRFSGLTPGRRVGSVLNCGVYPFVGRVPGSQKPVCAGNEIVAPDNW